MFCCKRKQFWPWKQIFWHLNIFNECFYLFCEFYCWDLQNGKFFMTYLEIDAISRFRPSFLHFALQIGKCGCFSTKLKTSLKTRSISHKSAAFLDITRYVLIFLVSNWKAQKNCKSCQRKCKSDISLHFNAFQLLQRFYCDFIKQF